MGPSCSLTSSPLTHSNDIHQTLTNRIMKKIRLFHFLSAIALMATLTACNEKSGNESAPESSFDQAVADSTLKVANDAFYAALNSNFTGDTAPLQAIWSHGTDVSDQGPFGARLDGWDAVNAQFIKEGAMKLGGTVLCKDLIIRAGKDFGYTACIEEGANMSADGKPVVVRFRATNIFRKEDGQWKMVHHHTDISKPLEEATGTDNDAKPNMK